MMEKVETYIVDTDNNFIELIKQALLRTNNLRFKNKIGSIEDLQKIKKSSTKKLFLINIDLENPSYSEFINLIEKEFTNSLSIIMNLDEKKFSAYQSEEKAGNEFLDKANLFDEILKISKYFNQQKITNTLIN